MKVLKHQGCCGMMLRKEDFAVVLDFLPHGKAGEAKQEPVVQAIGDYAFTLLELVSKTGVSAEIGERVYVGREQRDKIDHIRGRISYRDLTSSAQRQLDKTVREIIKTREKDFVSFINTAGAVNIRSHTLEHLPSVGKKHLQTMLEERHKKPFENFEDIHARVPHLGNPLEIFAQRVTEELKGGQKYYLFTKKPPDEEEPRRW